MCNKSPCRVLRFPVRCLTVSLARSGLVRGGLHQLAVTRLAAGCDGLYTCQDRQTFQCRHLWEFYPNRKNNNENSDIFFILLGLGWGEG